MGQVEDYLTAKTNFEKIDSEIRNLAVKIQQVGSAMANNPGRFIFSNSGKGLPPEASMSRDSISANADHWPSADKIMEMLSQWHDAKDKAERAWGAVSQEHRNNLVPMGR